MSCARMYESNSDKPRKSPAAYLVILVNAVPEPAPNKASVAPPPKAMPAPASFLGSWIKTSKINSRQSSTRMTVRKPIRKLIKSSVHAVFDDIGKTAVFQRRAANERAIHVALAHQLA